MIKLISEILLPLFNYCFSSQRSTIERNVGKYIKYLTISLRSRIRRRLTSNLYSLVIEFFKMSFLKKDLCHFIHF